jgi:hypothetical protein
MPIQFYTTIIEFSGLQKKLKGTYFLPRNNGDVEVCIGLIFLYVSCCSDTALDKLPKTKNSSHIHTFLLKTKMNKTKYFTDKRKQKVVTFSPLSSVSPKSPIENKT